MKQPPKRPRAAGKSTKKLVDQPETSESETTSLVNSDVIPPEVHDAVEVSEPVMSKPEIAPEPEKPAPETVASTAPTNTAQTVASEPAPRRSFIPLVLGGVIAGAIGFAVASLTNPPATSDLDQLFAAQEARITSLQDDISSQEPVDLTAVTQAQDDFAAQLAEMQLALNDLRTDLDERPMATPQTDDNAPPPDTSVFEAEIDALRAQLNEMTDIARTELDAARAEAASIEESATAAAANAAGRAALARLQVSLETGAPLGAALNDLEDALGAPAPDALLAAQDGVPTLAALQESFPGYARAALTTARVEGVSGEDSTGVGAFLRNQFAVRSVNPQEGDTADAVLSRAQAAVRDGRIADALAEINALPEVARADMAEWTVQAEIRADAVAATDTLATSLRDN